MPTETVVMNRLYIHDSTKTVMRMERVSAPCLDNIIIMVAEQDFLQDGFIHAWRGTWEMFFAEWSEFKQETNSTNVKQRNTEGVH